MGRSYLQEISRDVLLWRDNGQELEAISSEAEWLIECGNEAVSSISEYWLETRALGNALGKVNEIDENLSTAILRGAFSSKLRGQRDSLKNGRTLATGRMRAEVIISASGVTVDTILVGDPTQLTVTKVQGEPGLGEVFRGHVGQLSTNPQVGGRLVLSSLFKPVILTGLVNPEDGTPNIELNIFAKRKA
jgi:hypothetical protein